MAITTPFTWEEVALGDVIDIYDHLRVPLSTRERSLRQGSFPYYGASGIIDYIDDYIFDGKYLLVAEDGANLVTRKTPVAFFASGKFWVNNHAHVIKGKPGIVDDYHLLAFFESSDISGYITGTAQPKLSQANLKAIKIKLPPISVQEEISSVLSAYDDLIENNTRRIQILEEIAQAIYREWFVEFRFPGHKDVRMVESELGLVPEGWEVVRYTDLIEVLSGGTPRTKEPNYWGGEIPWFTPKDLNSTYYVLDTERKITALGLENCNSKLYPADTVFITARGTVGRCALAAVPMAMSQTSYALIGKDNFSQYLVHQLTLDLVDTFKGMATGAVFDTIVIDSFRQQRILKPPLQVVSEFHAITSPIYDAIKNLQKKSLMLKDIRDLVLPNLISGKIDLANQS